MQQLVLILVFSLALAADARAGAAAPNAQLRPAQQALAAGDYDRAYAQFSRHPKNPLAQFTLALFHQFGWGRPVDPVRACRLFQPAAEKNIPAAQHFLGDCLARGIHQNADAAQAIAWYRKAAAQGHLTSLCSAGELYIEGRQVPKDVSQGLALCVQAAQGNVPPAMLKLADYYREGKDVPQDLAAARYWYQQGAERRVASAQYQLGLMLAEGAGGEPDPAGARFWLETAAANGHAAAYLPTAILYAQAEPAPDTGMLAPEHLAKIYLWLGAAKARPSGPEQAAEIERIEALVLAVMPPTWRPQLDRQVAGHLAKYQSGSPSNVSK